MISPHKTPVLAKMAMLLLFAIGAVAVLGTNTISAQELGRTITSPFGIARQTSTSESGTDGDTFVDPETGEVGHIIRNPFGVANPEGVDTGIDIPDSGEEEVGGIITNPFGTPNPNGVDTGVDVLDENEEYLISLPDDEESDAEDSEDVNGVDDETSDDAKEIEEDSEETATEKYVPVIDNPIRGGEYPLCEIIKLEAQYDSQDIISWSSYPNFAPTIYVQAGSTFTIEAFSSTGSWPDANPTWDFTDNTHASTSSSDMFFTYNAWNDSSVTVIVNPAVLSGSYTLYATCQTDIGGYISRKCINVIVCSLQFTVENPVLPSNGQVDYHSILVTNVADELPFTGKPDYADFEERVCESSIKTLHFQINAQNARFQDCKLRVAYEGVDDINAIEVPELISAADLALLKDIYMRGNNRYYDYTALKRGVLRVWTSSKPVLQDGEWISNSEMSTTSARDKKKYGIGDGNYLAPTNQPGEAYTFADLFPNQNSNSMPHDITFYVEGINQPSGNEYGNIIVTLLCYNPAINKWVDVASETVSFKIIEANVILNANNDPNYNLNDFDHKIKDQHDGFQGWFADQFDDSNKENTHGYENLFPVLVKNLTPLPQGMKYVLKINNDGVLLKHPVDIQNNQSNILDYIKKGRVVEDLDRLFSEPNLPTDLVIDTTNQVLTNGLFYLFAICRRYGVITDNGRISIYLSTNENNVQTNLIELDSARYTFRTIDKYFELWSTRNEEIEYFSYPADYGVTVNNFPTYSDAVQLPQFSQQRDNSRGSLLFIHGFNSTEADAFEANRVIYRRLYWTGYRGNYIGFSWKSDEGLFDKGSNSQSFNTNDITEKVLDNKNDSEGQKKLSEKDVNDILNNVTNTRGGIDWNSLAYFKTNNYNAMRTSRALKVFLNSLPKGHDVSIVAHSLGNLLMWDALRLHQADSQTRNRTFLNAISVQGAVWQDAFLDYLDREYNDQTNDPNDAITYYKTSDLKKNSWAFWFRQNDNKATDSVSCFVNSRTNNDQTLSFMKVWNALFCSHHYNRESLTSFRTPMIESLPSMPALMKYGSRRNYSLYPDWDWLEDPMGIANIGRASNLNATNLETNGIQPNSIADLTRLWENNNHNDMRDKCYCDICDWYYYVFVEMVQIINPNI